jgi:VanZ family protein
VTERPPEIARPSHTSRRFPGSTGDRWLLAWTGLTAILLLLPSSYVPDVGQAGEWGLDKVAHVLFFLVLAALAVAPARARVRHPVVTAAVASFVYGAVLELLQAALGWRSAELADLIADGIGSTIGALAAQVWSRA